MTKVPKEQQRGCGKKYMMKVPKKRKKVAKSMRKRVYDKGM